MGWRSKVQPDHHIDDMVREELRRLGYADRQPVSRRDFHIALGLVSHRLLNRSIPIGASR